MSLSSWEGAGDRVYVPGIGHGEVEKYDEYEVGIRFDDGNYKSFAFDGPDYDTIITLGGPIC